MNYFRPIKVKKTINKRLLLSNFNGGINNAVDEMILPQTTAKMCYNFTGKSGALTHFGGLNQFEIKGLDNILYPIKLPDDVGVARMWYFKRTDDSGVIDDRIMVVGSDMQLYTISLVDCIGAVKIEGIIFNDIPTATNYKLGNNDVIIMSSSSDNMLVYNGIDAPYMVASAPQLSSMCVHYERLFATIEGSNTLWFSDDLDPTNWNIALDQAGYIEMADEKGSLLRVISFHDYVYVFRRHGIARVSAYTDQAEFAVSQLFYTSGKIYPDTVTVCGDRIMFLSEDGLYSFDGINATKVLTNISDMFSTIDNNDACGCYFLGTYYLALRANFDDDDEILCESGSYFNNTLLCINLQDGSVSIMRGIDIRCMLSLQSHEGLKLLLATRNSYINSIGEFNNSGVVYDRILPKKWLCPSTNLGVSDRTKRLKQIYLFNRHDIVINIIVDGLSTNYYVRASDKVNTVKINAIGNMFSISFISTTECAYISQPLILFAVS